MKLKSEKNSGLKGIRTHDLCDTGAVLYQLSYQAIWELATLWVRNIPVEGEEYRWIYFIYLNCACILHLPRVYYELTKWPAPRWLDSSVGRALHRYRRGHRVESPSGLNFFQALISQLLKLLHNWDDQSYLHDLVSFTRSAKCIFSKRSFTSLYFGVWRMFGLK